MKELGFFPKRNVNGLDNGQKREKKKKVIVSRILVTIPVTWITWELLLRDYRRNSCLLGSQ